MTRNRVRSLPLPSVAIGAFLLLAVAGGGCSKKEEGKELAPPPTATPEGAGQAQPATTPVEVATAAPTPIPAEVLSGKVVQVVRADTLKVQEGKKSIEVKLYGILLPGKKAAILKQAKAYVAKLVLKKKISVEVKEKSRSRIIGIVTLASGTNLNHELVRRGYVSLSPTGESDEAAVQLQEQAKAAKKGLWAEPKKKHRVKR